MEIATFQLVRGGTLIFASLAPNRVEQVSLNAIPLGVLCGLFDWFICRKQNAYDYREQWQQEVHGKH